MSSHHQHLPAGGISASSVSGWPSAHAGVESSHQQSNTSRVDVGSSDAGSNLAAWERPRVRAEGPGGPEVKQGARIACLDCRLAKIRCSAPTDGIVPCKRCARHDRECVFEKHRRGRKPGRWNGAGAPASGHSHEAHYSGSASTSSSPVEFRRPRSEHHSEPSVMVPAPVSQHFPTHHPGMDTVSSFGRPASQWSSNAPRNSNEYGRSQVAQVIPDVHNSHRTAHGTRSDGHAPHASEPFSMGSAMHDSGAAGRSSVGTPASTSSYSPMIPNVRSASASATSQSSLRSAAWPGPISMPPPVRLHSANTLEHHTPGTASIPRSWNDFASPSRSLLSPGMSLAYGTPGSATGNVHPGSHLNTSAPYPAAQPMVGTPKRKADEDAHSYVGDSHRFSNEDAKRPRASDPAVQSEPSRSIPMETNSAASTSEEDDADEIDQLDEDALGEGADNEDVLQIPLRLLAHASEGMAATKAGEQKQSTGAATIGLVSPPRPRPRPSMLSHLVAAAGAHHPMRDRTLPRLPHVSTMAARSNIRTQMSPPAPRPSIIGRSRSYTAIEAASVQARLKQEAMMEAIQQAAAAERPQVLGTSPSPAPSNVIVGNLMGAVKDASNAIIDAGAYEYRGGKTRSKAGITGSATTPTSTSGPDASQEPPEDLAGGHGEMAAARSRSSRPVSSGRGPESESPAPPTGTSHTGSNTGSGSGGMRRSKSGVRALRRRSRAGMDDVELGSGAHIAGDTPALDGAAERSDELEAGASHPEYWMLSPFASKLDVEKGDPVDVGFATMSELRDLFDIFFNRINPLLNLLDPFLHSVSYTRSRSALLTTVIAAFAARLSDSQRDAELAVLMERHWRETLVPEVLLGGYKSVELSQAFLLLSLYGKPTQRLADDRSWQYLGYAIRTGTEIGINRRVAPSESLEDSEQLRRRIRNRWRTWMCLFISDRTLSAQTGRPFTISTDELISSVGTNFHRADWALPQDVSLVSLVQLRRLIAQHESAFNNFVTAALVAQGAPNAQGEEPDGRRRSGDVDLRELEAYRQQANSDLERWKEAWCVSAADEAHVQSLAMADFLVRWRPTAMLHYRHARLYLNSIVLQTFEQHSGEEYSIPTALDCWNNATALIDVLLDDITQEDLESSPNQTAIMATWTAMTALRLTKLDRVKHPWVDRYAIIDRAKRLAKALARAGRSPAHRNGAAGPYGSWLRSVLELYIPESERADHSAASPLLRTKPDVKMDASEEMSLNGDSTSPSASSALVGLALDDAAPDRSSSEPSVAASTAISEAATLLAHTVPLLSSSNEMSVEGAITTAEPVSPQVKPSSGSVIGLTEAEHLFAAGLPLTHGSSSPANVASLSNKKPDASDLARGAAIATMPPVAHGTIGSAMPSTTTTAAAAAPPPNGEHQPSCDPEHNIDMAFDYLTAFNSPSSGFPGGLWQPQSTWGGGMS